MDVKAGGGHNRGFLSLLQIVTASGLIFSRWSTFNSIYLVLDAVDCRTFNLSIAATSSAFVD